MLATKDFRFYDFKFHLAPEAHEISISIDSSAQIKKPASGERSRVLVLLEINCEGENPEDFYFRALASCEVWDEDGGDIRKEDYAPNALPLVLREIQERAERIANEMNVPRFDFLKDENILQGMEF